MLNGEKQVWVSGIKTLQGLAEMTLGKYLKDMRETVAQLCGGRALAGQPARFVQRTCQEFSCQEQREQRGGHCKMSLER